MNHSEEINEVALALHGAQAEMGGAVKNSNNPFFKSDYASLTDVIKAMKEPFHNHGLVVTQFPITSPGGGGVGVETIIMHTSGQWMSNEFVLPLTKGNAQDGGSAITYARRYALQAITVLPSVDDDAQAASMTQKPKSDDIDRDLTEEEVICGDAAKRHHASVVAVKNYLGDELPESLLLAKEAWGEINEADQMSMWKAPTKCMTAPFTTEERRLLKGG